MGLAFDFDVFKGTFRYSLVQTFRLMNASWFIGFQVLYPIFFILTSWTILQILGPSSIAHFTELSGYPSYVPFVIVGFAFQAVIMNAAWCGSNAIRSEQQIGTLEPIFVTPSSKVAWMLGKMSGNIVIALVSTILVLAAGALILPFTLTAFPNILTAVVGVSLSVFGLTAFSFALGGLTFLAKRTEDINQVLWPALIFLTGLAFPVQALPGWAQDVAWFLPITHGLAITRGAVLKGYGIFDQNLTFSFISIFIQIAAYVPVGYFSFRIFLRMARKRGALATY